jgi:hypothetical protein
MISGSPVTNTAPAMPLRALKRISRTSRPCATREKSSSPSAS